MFVLLALSSFKVDFLSKSFSRVQTGRVRACREQTDASSSLIVFFTIIYTKVGHRGNKEAYTKISSANRFLL